MSILLNVSEKITVGSVPKEYAVLRRRVLADGGTISDEPLFKQEMVQAWETKPEYQAVLGASKVSKLYGFPDGDYTFTRSGEATRTAQNGLLATVPSNFPVVNFDDGDLLGYYSQRAATNLLQRSEEFDNAVWINAINGTGINPARTANVAIAPDGTQTADRVFFDQGAGVGSDFSFIRSSEVSVTVQSYTASIWLKADTVDDIGKQLLIRHAGAAQYGVFTLTADWQRVNRTESAGIITTRRFEIGVRTGEGGNAPQVSALLWGAQLEVGSVATSYIKTTTTAVTRPADIATASGLTLSPLSNVQFKANFPTDYPLVIAGLQATVSGYRTIRLELSPTEKTLFVDGVEEDTDTGSYDWSGITSIELGHFDGGEQPNFEIADLRINE
jgi:hypothetical protein